MLSLFIFLLILFAIWFTYRISNTVFTVTGHWKYYFDNFAYSSEEFYKALQKIVQSKSIPNVEMALITYSEGGILSANRKYFRVERDKIVFDICAAPFASGFFISSWQGELPQLWQKIVAAIPVIGPPLEHMFFKKTYYQMDVEQMFASAVHSCVLEGIKNIVVQTGRRDLTELERQLNQIGK